MVEQESLVAGEELSLFKEINWPLMWSGLGVAIVNSVAGELTGSLHGLLDVMAGFFILKGFYQGMRGFVQGKQGQDILAIGELEDGL